jgi:hypothetical protein
MTMKVTIEQHCIVSGTLLCKHLRVVDRGMQKLRGVCPSTIEVDSQYVATVISVNHAIRVKHGHNFKNELFSEGLGFFARGLEQKVYHALYHEGGVGLSWVHSSSHEDHLLIG